MNRKFELEGLKQPLEAVCDCLEQSGKEIFARSLRDIHEIATESNEQLAKAVEIIKGEYPEHQWVELGVPEMEKALGNTV